jgi:hypothetical protein
MDCVLLLKPTSGLINAAAPCFVRMALYEWNSACMSPNPNHPSDEDLCGIWRIFSNRGNDPDDPIARRHATPQIRFPVLNIVEKLR